MANGALLLVARRTVEPFEAVRIRALRARTVERSPVVDPALLEHAVLNWENVDLPVRKLRCVGLLPLPPDGVIDGICAPAPIGLPDPEVMPAGRDEHASKQLRSRFGLIGELAVHVLRIGTRVELVVPLEIS